MNQELLLAHFNRISDAPGAVKHLRRFVYRLAVRGKLTDRAPGDESTSELLNRIHAGKIQRMKNGKAEIQPLIRIDAGDAPITVPKHWVWLPLNDIGTFSGGMTPSKNRPEFWDGEINWFSPKDIKSDELLSSEMKITSIGARETGLQLYPPGCLFIVARSGILKRTLPVSINRVEATVNQDLKVLNPFVSGMERYLQIMFMGMTDFILSALVKTGTTVQSLKYEEFELQPIPLPSLSEQRRVVAKVHELMSLCDRLEVHQRERDARRNRLTAASHHYLNNGADTDTLRKHAHFFTSHLLRLSTHPDQINQLRQTILNVATRGQLVPQENNPRSACDLIDRIKVERNRRIDSGRIKPVSSLKITGHEKRFDYPIPSCWIFCFVDDVALKVTDGEHATPKRSQAGYYLLSARNVTNNGIDVSDVDFVPEEEYRRIRRRCDPDKGDILISCSGSIGRVAVVDQDNAYTMVRSAALIKLDTSHINPRYIAYVLRAGPAQEQIGIYSKSTAQANLFIGAIRKLRIPLPPLAEQNRIVARVDELIAFCDQLEAQLTSAQADISRLLAAVLDRALNDSNPSAASWPSSELLALRPSL